MTVETRKDEQGWTKDSPKCANCELFYSEIVRGNWGVVRETGIRCLKGSFATKKTAWCKAWERRKD